MPPRAPASGAPIFSVRGRRQVYRTGEAEVHALRGVDLELLEGEMIALTGPSGSGKSTLPDILGGLDRRAPASARSPDEPAPSSRRH